MFFPTMVETASCKVYKRAGHRLVPYRLSIYIYQLFTLLAVSRLRGRSALEAGIKYLRNTIVRPTTVLDSVSVSLSVCLARACETSLFLTSEQFHG